MEEVVVGGAVAVGEGVGEALGTEEGVGVGRVEFAHDGPHRLVLEHGARGERDVGRGCVRIGEHEDGIH